MWGAIRSSVRSDSRAALRRRVQLSCGLFDATSGERDPATRAADGVGVGPQCPAGLSTQWVSTARPPNPDAHVSAHPALHMFEPMARGRCRVANLPMVQGFWSPNRSAEKTGIRHIDEGFGRTARTGRCGGSWEQGGDATTPAPDATQATTTLRKSTTNVAIENTRKTTAPSMFRSPLRMWATIAPAK